MTAKITSYKIEIVAKSLKRRMWCAVSFYFFPDEVNYTKFKYPCTYLLQTGSKILSLEMVIIVKFFVFLKFENVRRRV